MRWTPGGQSEDIEDRRSVRVGRTGVGVGLTGVLVLAALSLLTGKNFLALIPALQQGGEQVETTDEPIQSTPEEEQRVQFVSFVLDDAQNTWNQLLPGRYQRAKLVLFRNARHLDGIERHDEGLEPAADQRHHRASV